jgi:polyribonucleotide nucleotidyltransferase
MQTVQCSWKHALPRSFASAVTRDAKVDSVEKFGLFVEVLPGKTGLVHMSELDTDRTASLSDWSPGDTMDVKLLEVGRLLDTPAFLLKCLYARQQLPDIPFLFMFVLSVND